ncbi:MAG: YkgJ family cysteine cluster protein [Myxococcota bacterium]
MHLDALEAVYRAVARRTAGSSCLDTTECCRFGVTGREPYVTSIEVLAVRRALAQRGGPLAPRRRALPLLGSARPADERACPMLDRAGRCAVYASRPLGCRTFFCTRADHAGGQGPLRQRELTGFVRQVQDVAASHERGGDRGRPLTRALADLPL